MPDITYRKCRKSDSRDITEICYRTGYMGEDLTGTERFNDKKLFGYLFCLYYVLFESNNSFVAVDGERVVGYILSSRDTKKQEKKINRRMMWKVVMRTFFYTIWRYPESFKEVIIWHKNHVDEDIESIVEKYPAHLHIDILPEYHGMGIGTVLLEKLEHHHKSINTKGIHLATSNHNHKAVPFYKKYGYKVLIDSENKFWSDVQDYSDIILGKVLIE